MTLLRCQGCGKTLPFGTFRPFQCPNAGKDGGDHVVGRTLDDDARFPEGKPDNPFVRYRQLTYAYALARSKGMTDEAFVALVRDLDRRVAEIEGHGFQETPFGRNDRLSSAVGLAPPGGVWVKDETGNVGGSHKGRHLMGLAILAEVESRLAGSARGAQELAIASCGNAALAAAVVAAAVNRPIDVFIPKDANPRVVAALERLGARTHVCARTAGRTKGDPCYVAFQAAVRDGKIPFCCQGPDNGLTIEGGETLAWEIVGDLVASGVTPDRLFVQVGGGALASACIAGFRDAVGLGVPVRMPRIHAVQTRGGFPLRRAWERVTERLAESSGIDPDGGDQLVAERLREHARRRALDDVIDYAAHHRSEFMWPWETEPVSVAHGILDDETYDWLSIVRAMVETGGYPVVVGDARLLEANALGRDTTKIDADETGTAGLAGLLELSSRGEVSPAEKVVVLFTGVRR